jgi:hypothetical protein
MRAHPHERFSSTVRLSPSAVATYAQAAGTTTRSITIPPSRPPRASAA